MRIAVTGSNGYVGKQLLKLPNVFPLVGDVTNPSEIEMSVAKVKPDVIVHLASISDVDDCDEPDFIHKVTSVNVGGTFTVAEAADRYGCGMVLLSTSHVFSGKRLWGTYREWEIPHPINAYGISKFAAENIHLIFPSMKVVRTSYLFDRERLNPHLVRMQKPIDAPTFIERSFMYLPHFIHSFYQYLQRYHDMPKMLHISGTESVSWYEFLHDVASCAKVSTHVVQPRTKEIEGMAPRPYRAGLNVDRSRRLGLPQNNYMNGLRSIFEW